jgi:hypothetical protein
VARRLVNVVVVALACLGGARLGLWFVPFALGAAEGAAFPRWRGNVWLVAAGAVAGWALSLWIMALAGQPVGATARAVAGLAGLPPYAAVTVTVTLVLAALQALAGGWLGRAVRPGAAPGDDRLRVRAARPDKTE